MQSQKSYTLDRQPLYVGQLQQDQHQALLGGAYGQSNLSSSTHALTEVKPTEVSLVLRRNPISKVRFKVSTSQVPSTKQATLGK